MLSIDSNTRTAFEVSDACAVVQLAGVILHMWFCMQASPLHNQPFGVVSDVYSHQSAQAYLAGQLHRPDAAQTRSIQPEAAEINIHDGKQQYCS